MVVVANIKTYHPCMEDYREAWCIMRDTVDGEDTVKEKGELYLPMKSAVRAMTDERLRSHTYLSYMRRAEFPELVSPTIIGSGGMLTDQPPTIELPKQLEYLLEDADGAGTTLEMFHKKIVNEVLTTGRYGVLPGPLDDGTFVLTGYKAESILNWDHDERKRVNFVVLDETDWFRDPLNNTWSKKERFLELTIDETGAYVAQRWNDEGAPEAEAVVARRPDQQALARVPFVFINTLGLQADPDDIPMYGLAKIALRIYRLDADYMQGLHMTSEPTPYVTGFDNATDAIANGDVPTTIGAANLWILPKSATAGFLEFSGLGLGAQAQAIEASLERAAVFGASMLTSSQGAGDESGESRKLRLRDQQSLLRSVAKTTAAGLEQALRNIALWSGLDPKTVTVRPYLDFVDYTLSAQELTALVAGWQSGAYSKRTLFENMQRADMIPADRSFEDEEDLIATEGPPLGTVVDTSTGTQPGQPDPAAKPGATPEGTDPAGAGN
jgi:hypothetical protein